MKKWSTIRTALNKEIPKELVNEPSKYVFGQWWKGSAAIESANQIFGAENWTDSLQYVNKHVLPEGLGILFEAAVTVTATGLTDKDDIQTVSHDGLGAGMAQATFDKKKKEYLPLKPQVVRTALMASKTYATKRALRHYGVRLGAQLYFDDDEALALLDEEEKQARRDEKKEEAIEDGVLQYGPPVADDKGMILILPGKPKKPIGDLVGDSRVGLIDFMTKTAKALPQFAGHGPRFERHLKKHFGAEDVSTLNWGQMVAVLCFGESGLRHSDFYDTPKVPKTVVAASTAAVDEMADIVAFFKEHSVPDTLIDDITSTHFPEALTSEDAKAILAALQSSFDKLGGLDGICEDGKMTAALSTIIMVSKPPPF